MKKLPVIALACITVVPAAVTGADIEAGREKASTCAACHGVDGNSANPQWPKLAGQHPQYIYKQLQDFKQGARADPIMSPQARSLSDQDMRDLAAYYAAQTTSLGTAGEELPQLGKRIYHGGIAERGIPACMACHGPAGQGNAPAAFPKLSYQHAPYVASELRTFRAGKRDNDPAGMMRDSIARMTDEEIEAVARYVSGLHRAQKAALER